jgi:adenylate cyclase
MKLNDLHPCFEGVIPSKFATCAKDGTPNASYLSHVYFVDDKHVATSYQFFNKTRANLLENPYASLQLRHPANMKPYKLKIKYLRSEESGPLFETMAVKLDVIAAYEGMGSTFRLKAADIYEVLEIEECPQKTTYNPDMACPNENLQDLELVRVISDRIARTSNTEELLDGSLEMLNKYLGLEQMIILLADAKEKTLLTHASFGYPQGGTGSEVRYGDGLIGMSAEIRRQFQVSSIREAKRYAKAVQGSTQTAGAKIPLPGLPDPASQIATPISAAGDFLGVLAVESNTRTYWGARDLLLLSTVANMIGMGLKALEGQDEGLAPRPAESAAAPARVQKTAYRFRFVEGDDFIFVNDQYLIKNIPARILRYLLSSYLKTGRTDFSNIELRAEKSLNLPDFKDNLETRLILLRKRLEEQESGVRLASTGRGKFRLEICGQVELA